MSTSQHDLKMQGIKLIELISNLEIDGIRKFLASPDTKIKLLNVLDAEKKTPLMIAAELNSYPAAEILISHLVKKQLSAS